MILFELAATSTHQLSSTTMFIYYTRPLHVGTPTTSFALMPTMWNCGRMSWTRAKSLNGLRSETNKQHANQSLPSQKAVARSEESAARLQAHRPTTASTWFDRDGNRWARGTASWTKLLKAGSTRTSTEYQTICRYVHICYIACCDVSPVIPPLSVKTTQPLHTCKQWTATLSREMPRYQTMHGGGTGAW